MPVYNTSIPALVSFTSFCEKSDSYVLLRERDYYTIKISQLFTYGGDCMRDQECDVCEELCEHPNNICLAKADAIADDDAQQIAELFKILGDTTRVKILQALSKRDLCVCDLAAVINMGQSAVSHQLRLLRNVRLVKHRKDGKMVWYSLDDSHIATLLCQGIEHIQHR